MSLMGSTHSPLAADHTEQWEGISGLVEGILGEDTGLVEGTGLEGAQSGMQEAGRDTAHLDLKGSNPNYNINPEVNTSVVLG